MIVIPDEVDQELRRAAAAQRSGALRGIGEILPELLAHYGLARFSTVPGGPPLRHISPTSNSAMSAAAT